MKNGNIVAGSRDGTVKVWDINKSVCILNIKAHNNFIYAIKMLVDGNIATGSADNTIKIWNSKNGDLIKKLIGHKFPVRGL